MSTLLASNGVVIEHGVRAIHVSLSRVRHRIISGPLFPHTAYLFEAICTVEWITNTHTDHSIWYWEHSFQVRSHMSYLVTRVVLLKGFNDFELCELTQMCIRDSNWNYQTFNFNFCRNFRQNIFSFLNFLKWKNVCF